MLPLLLASAAAQDETSHNKGCDEHGYRVGRWVPTPEQAAPYRLHRDVQRNPLVKGWAYAGRRFWGACDEGLADNATREAVQQRWQPARCELQPFDAAALCQRLVLGKRSDWSHARRPRADPPLDILFVGDSFTGQLFISFVSLLRGSILRNEGAPRTAPSGAMVFGDIPIAELRADAVACIDDAAALRLDFVDDVPGKGQHAPLRVSFVRNEGLSLNTVEPTSGYRHQYPFTHRIGPRTLLVTQARPMNACASHRTPSAACGRAADRDARRPDSWPASWTAQRAGPRVGLPRQLARELDCDMPSRRLRFTAAASRQVLAWFHNDDKSFATKLQGLLDLARSRMGAPEWARSFVLFSASYAHFSCKTKVAGREVVPGKGPKPGQHDYALLNRIGENMTRTAGATFLDVTTMLERRPDGHMPHDCGHWCLPGPYDIGALLLFNALMGHIDAPLSLVRSPPRLSQVQSPPRYARRHTEG